jgi:hypothetical protein
MLAIFPHSETDFKLLLFCIVGMCIMWTLRETFINVVARLLHTVCLDEVYE